MDIGEPLGTSDRSTSERPPLLVGTLTEADWTSNTLARTSWRAGARPPLRTSSSSTIGRWRPHLGIEHFEDRVYLWAKDRGLDPEQYLPIAREDTDVWPVFTLEKWLRYRDVLGPLVEQVIAPLKTPYGVIKRLALVRLPAGGYIPPHIDGQEMATKAHGIHVPLTFVARGRIQDRRPQVHDARRPCLRLQQTASAIRCATRASGRGSTCSSTTIRTPASS